MCRLWWGLGVEESSKAQILPLGRFLLWQDTLGSFRVRFTPALGSEEEEEGRDGKQAGGAALGEWRQQSFPWGSSAPAQPRLEQNFPLQALLGLAARRLPHTPHARHPLPSPERGTSTGRAGTGGPNPLPHLPAFSHSQPCLPSGASPTRAWETPRSISRASRDLPQLGHP